MTKRTIHPVDQYKLQIEHFSKCILEGTKLTYPAESARALGLIDKNQNDRLNICFVMRNNAAHPGETRLTSENLASFYSDIKTIIFDNPNFTI
jgi:hypothetical protein